jgi:hypothetical protein
MQKECTLLKFLGTYNIFSIQFRKKNIENFVPWTVLKNNEQHSNLQMYKINCKKPPCMFKPCFALGGIKISDVATCSTHSPLNFP